MDDGEILAITPDGKIIRSEFTVSSRYTMGLRKHYDWFDCEDDNDNLLEVCGSFGVGKEEIQFLRSCGYDDTDIEDMLYNGEILSVVEEIKDMIKMERR